MTDPLVRALADAVGERHVLADGDLRAPYERDWTGRWSGRARAVVRPADTAEVAAVVRACAAAGTPVVPQGGNTGLVGGGVPRGGEVLVSLARLSAVGDLDAAAGQVDAGAGATLAALQARAAEAGLDAGLDFPSPVPSPSPAYVLVERAADDDTAEALGAAGLDDAVLADDTAGRERLWRVREHLTEAIAAAGTPHKLDVGVPPARLGAFADRVHAEVERVAPGARVLLFGHLGDGNVHVNVLGPPPGDDAVDDAVLGLAAELGGTISAEYGVGVAKVRHLQLVRGPADLAAMRAIKRALDPESLLNPGGVLAR